MKLNRRLTVMVVVMGALSVLIFGAVGVPSIMAVRKLRMDIAEQYLEIERRYSLRQHTRSSLTDLETIQPTLKRLSSIVLIEGDELAFISALEQAAGDSGVTQDLALETVNQKDISPWERDVPIRIRAAGQYDNVLAFLERFQAIPYYIVIRDMDLANPDKTPDKSGDGTIQLEIRGVIRWFAKTHPIFSRSGGGPSTAAPVAPTAVDGSEE